MAGLGLAAAAGCFLGASGMDYYPTIVFHELITNSFDACEEAGILPDIDIELKRYMGYQTLYFEVKEASLKTKITPMKSNGKIYYFIDISAPFRPFWYTKVVKTRSLALLFPCAPVLFVVKYVVKKTSP